MITILIVDDSDEDRYILKRLLKKTGLELTIVEVCDGAEAMEFMHQSLSSLKSFNPDIRPPITLFLDINMPVMNGWNFLDKLNEKYDTLEIKPAIVLMYTTSNSDFEKQKALSYPHVLHYITKDQPDIEVLKQTVLLSQK